MAMKLSLSILIFINPLGKNSKTTSPRKVFFTVFNGFSINCFMNFI